MRQMFLIPGLFLLSFAACKKDTSAISVSGVYTENSPVAGRSQLNFISSNLVIKSETASTFKDTFNYAISPGKIELKPISSNQSPSQKFDFEKLDDNTIKIENLMPSIPDAPKSYMIFKK